MSPLSQVLMAIAAVMSGAAHAATMRLTPQDLTVRAASVTGDMTHYPTGLGACGIVNGEGDPIVSISHLLFDPQTPNGNPNNNPLCGRQSVVVKTEDRCEGCAINDVDVPIAVFSQLDNPDLGRVQVTWDWI
ncbi:RlpA-like double-psi beta-barrel-protein domain-containing protein-containing protein [Xylariaceae sp. FL1272]|nr:RlpA-like double-psi beta-barrel-protein domain-containing protein-containing protein [Xylariaceae sp. FL1272]